MSRGTWYGWNMNCWVTRLTARFDGKRRKLPRGLKPTVQGLWKPLRRKTGGRVLAFWKPARQRMNGIRQGAA